MSQLNINIGQAANDKTGDTLRVAFNKVNTNFTEVYSGLASLANVIAQEIPSQTGHAGTVLSTDGTHLLWSEISLNTLNNNNHSLVLNSDGTITLPTGANFRNDAFGIFATDMQTTYNLDIRDVTGAGFFTNGTGYTLRSNGTYNWVFGLDGNLTIPNDGVITDGNNYLTTRSLYVQGNLKGVDGSTGSTGQILTRQSNGGVAWANPPSGAVSQLTNGSATASMDGTGTITMTAGGIIKAADNSFTGFSTYDQASFAYANADGITLSTLYTTEEYNWIFDNTGIMNLPVITVDTAAPAGWIQSPANILLNASGRNYTFGSDGILALPDGTNIYSVNNALFRIDTTQDIMLTAYTGSSPKSWRFGLDGTLHLPVYGDNPISLIQTTGNFQLSAGGKLWSFDINGNLTIPDSGDIKDVHGSSLFKTKLSEFTNDLSINANSLTGTTLANNITGSSLTSLGELSGLTSNGIVHITNTEDSFNSNTGSLQVDGGAHITKNLIAEGTIYAGVNAYSEVLVNPLIVASSPSSETGGYSQVAILNNSAGASGDYQVFVDGYDINGPSGDTGWVDMGYAGSNFSDPRYTITPPGTGYVFASGSAGSTNSGSLVLATDGSGTVNDIIFGTGGFHSSNEAMRLKNSDGSLNINSGKITSQNSLRLTATNKNWAFNTDGTLTTPGEVIISTNNTHGGSGYTGFLTLTSTQAGVTNPNKYIRLNSTGNLQIVNSQYSTTIFDLADNGDVTFSGTLHLPPGGDIKNSSGVSVLGTYNLPTASTSQLGGVKVDGTTITIDGNGVISSNLVGTVIFKGTWNASTNTPTLGSNLPAGVAIGWQYLVSATGTRNIGAGSQTYYAGDIVVYDGVKWNDIPGAGGSVASFNNRTGAVTLTSGDVTSALGFTPYDNTNPAGYITTSALSSYATQTYVTSQGYITSAGNAATATKLATARNINGVPFDGTGSITVTAAAGTLTGTTLNAGIVTSSLTTVGTLVNLTVTNPIAGSVTGSAGSVAGSAITGTTLASNVVSSSLTSVGTLANLTVTNPIVGTVENGVVTTGTYADPTWITSLAYSKLIGAPSAYTLPTASTSQLGGVKIDGTTITINNGVISSASAYTLPTASSTVLGGIKIGSGLSIDGSGVVTASGGAAGTLTGTTLASNVVNSSLTTLGTLTGLTSTGNISVTGSGKFVGDGSLLTNINLASNITGPGTNVTLTAGSYSWLFDNTGKLTFPDSTQQSTAYTGNAATVTNGVYTTGSYSDPSWITSLAYSKLTGTPAAYSLPTASTTVLGGVKVDGTTVTINGSGVISAAQYTLPTASTSVLGGVKVDGTTITINGSGVISAPATWNGGTVSNASTFSSDLTVNGSITRSGNISAAAWGVNGIGLKLNSATYTDTSSSGTLIANYINFFGNPTLAFSTATTVTNAATLFLGTPQAGTNATITNAYSLYAGGNSYINGTTTLNGAVTLNSTIKITGNILSGSGATNIVLGSNGPTFNSVATVSQYLLQNNLPSFRVVGNSNTAWSTTNPTGGVMTSSQWTQDYQQGTGLVGSTGIFTCAVAGIYSVTLSARLVNNTSPTAQCMIVKTLSGTSTTSTAVMLEWAANSTTNHLGAATNIKLAVGDTLKFVVTVGSITFDVNDNWSVAFLG